MDDDDFLARIAWHYYIEGLTQKEIAQRFHLARVKVTRLLKTARERGLVEIRIVNVQTSHLLLEKSLRVTFGLSDAIVVALPGRSEDLRRALGEAAAIYLGRVLRPGMSVGLGMGRTLSEIPNYVKPQQDGVCCFVEMVGGIGRGLTFDSYKVSSLLADRIGGEVEHLYAPVIVETAAVHQALLGDPQIKAMLERAAACDLALVSVGTVDLDSFLFQADYTDRAGIETLQRSGAVGDVLGHFFNIDGRPVSSLVDERLIGLSLSELKHIPTTICVAGGSVKTPAILGALRGQYMNVLITDEETARALLDRAQADADH